MIIVGRMLDVDFPPLLIGLCLFLFTFLTFFFLLKKRKIKCVKLDAVSIILDAVSIKDVKIVQS